MTVDETTIKKYAALALVLVFGVLLFLALLPYKSAFFGAIIFYVLFAPLYTYFNKKLNWKKSLSAVICILISILVVLVPLSTLAGLLVSQTSEFISSQQELISDVDQLDALIPWYDISAHAEEIFPKVGKITQNMIVGAAQGISSTSLVLIMMYFLLFYMFINSKTLFKKFVAYIPFNRKNSKRLLEEAENVTRATIISSGIIALIQGILLTLGLLIIGIKSPVLWGFIGAILSFLPLVGVSLIWIPASIILFVQGFSGKGIFLVLFGVIILGSVDYIVRPPLQKKFGKIHPLVSIIGVFMGIAFFGIIGLILGPLLINYFILLFQMFREEYLPKD